jgi:hypothetical protein
MNKEKFKKIPHIISGVIILLHAFERFESGHSTYIIFLLAGIVFLSIAWFHKVLTSKFPLIDILFYIIESILSFVIAYEYFSAGKKGLPYMYLVAAIMQLFACFMFFSKNKKT